MRKNSFIIGFICLILLASNVVFITSDTSASVTKPETPGSPTFDGQEVYTPIGMQPTADTLFNLTAMTNEGMRSDYLMYAKNDLAEIGIDLDVQNLTWPDFVDQLVTLQEFDMCYVGINDIRLNGIEDLYSEGGSLNFFNYLQTMDWQSPLGAGLNEWYLHQSDLINPPDSEERIDHIWEWQDYLMDKLLPHVPGFGVQDYQAYWSNLEGYNYTDGLLQSYGHMYWDGAHTGQISTNEFNMKGGTWDNLNPQFLFDSDDEFLTSLILDPLLWKDSDQDIHPHVLSDYVYMNDTWVRLTVRDSIKWADDPDGLFLNEYVDIEDVYFTLYCYWKVGSYQSKYRWIKDMQIVDNYTLDLFIDADDGTSTNEPEPEALNLLAAAKLMPEHYLNQTQISDDVTPDILHSSWTKYSTQIFGTGLFQLDDYTYGVDTNLSISPNCWWRNATLTSDPELEWVDRFGDYSGSPNYLNFKIINDFNVALADFDAGKLDIISINTVLEKIDEYDINPDIDYESKYDGHIGIYGFNYDPVRATPLQNASLCPHNSSLSIGLAIRKAISHAINRTKINLEVNNDTRVICQHPLGPDMGVWLNPNIVTYEYNITKAKEYLFYAGYETGLDSDGDNLTDLYEAEVSFSNRFSTDTDGDGLTDWQEVTIHNTDPAAADSDGDGLDDPDELFVYGTDPWDYDSDDDELSDGTEITLGTDPLDSDSEDDGMPDGWEVYYGLDPLINDSLSDPDLDDLTNIDEYLNGTNPQNEDTDGDGINDGDEVRDGFDPLDPNDPPVNGSGLGFIAVSFILFLALGFYGLFRRIRK